MRYPELDYSDDTATGLINRIEDIAFADVFALTECEVTADEEKRDTGQDAARSAIFEANGGSEKLVDVLTGYYELNANRLLRTYGLISTEWAA